MAANANTMGFALHSPARRALLRPAPGAPLPSGFTLVELLIVIGVLTLLIGASLTAVHRVRWKAADAKCAANLRSVGQTIQNFQSSHQDYSAPVLWGVDGNWADERRLGWDIETGHAMKVEGGAGSIWNCARQGTPYVGNAMALGYDARWGVGDGMLRTINTRWWREPARLALAFDVQRDMLEPPWRYANALDEGVGDLSDETFYDWSPHHKELSFGLYLAFAGPHEEAYGVLFGDGHAIVSTPNGPKDGFRWSGQTWW